MTTSDLKTNELAESIDQNKSASERLASEGTNQTNVPQKVKEINGPKGLEPTRYGDWESKGRCYDF